MSLSKKIILIVIINVVIIFSLEVVARKQLPIEEKFNNASSNNIITLLSEATISGRELGNQFLIHNTALFSKHTHPNAILRAYIGTSRSKMLRPSWYGESNAINASGNSYNEITYGVLLQAELLRLQFPNLKEVFVETSLLLRRPDRLIIEEDHKKYIGILKEVLPLKEKMLNAHNFLDDLNKLTHNAPRRFDSVYFNQRNEYQLGTLFNITESEGSKNTLLGYEEPYIKLLNENGERVSIPEIRRELKDQRPPILESHIKVQRLRDIESWYPWDGLFEMLAMWGREHKIQIIFYQSPVRSDLYEFQTKFGMNNHRADLIKISEKYQIPFIDFNKPELGFSNDWSLFADEDHLDTCLGIVYHLSGLDLGYKNFMNNKVLIHEIKLQDAINNSSKMALERCQH